MWLIRSLFLGIIAAFGALVSELAFFNLDFLIKQKEMETGYFQSITFLLVLAVLIEEIFKYLVIRQNSGGLPSKKVKFFSAALIGIGFSFLEIAFLFLSQNSLREFSLSSVSGTPIIHAATAGTMGYFIAGAKKPSLALAIKLVFFASIIHFIYNVLVIYDASNSLIYFYLIFLLLLLSFMVYRARKDMEK